jgi:hypothetical protein
LLDTSASAPSGTVVTGATQVAELAAIRTNDQFFAQVIPALLVVFALVLLAFGVPKLVGQRPGQSPPGERGSTTPTRQKSAIL